MTIHLPTPFRPDKKLGKAYNDEFKKIADDDWVLLRDYDTLFLLPETIIDIYGYLERFPDPHTVFTCYANRNHPSLPQQILHGKISENTDINFHIDLAIKQRNYLYTATEIKSNIAGFFMLVSKKLWNDIHFSEGFKSLGVDFTFSRELRRKGKKVLRMDAVYIWHTYRLHKGIHNKQHLL